MLSLFKKIKIQETGKTLEDIKNEIINKCRNNAGYYYKYKAFVDNLLEEQGLEPFDYKSENHIKNKNPNGASNNLQKQENINNSFDFYQLRKNWIDILKAQGFEKLDE